MAANFVPAINENKKVNFAFIRGAYEVKKLSRFQQESELLESNAAFSGSAISWMQMLRYMGLPLSLLRDNCMCCVPKQIIVAPLAHCQIEKSSRYRGYKYEKATGGTLVTDNNAH